MFDILVASRGVRYPARSWPSVPVVLLLHAAILGVVVSGARHPAVARPAPLVLTLPPPPATPGRVRHRADPKWRVPTVPPVVVPDGIAPPDLEITIDRGEVSWPGTPALPGGGGLDGDTDGPLHVSFVDERPELLSAPPLVYPDRLRKLGVGGLVTIRVVVDTNGRVEPASMTVVRTSHPDFVAPVRETLARALFRPARVHGRAVRVLVEIPFAFRLTPHR